MSWLNVSSRGIVLTVRVVPRAARDEIVGEMADALKVRLRAPPVDGKANKALVELLAERLGAPRRNIEIVGGELGRIKRVLIRGVSESGVRHSIF